MNTTKLTRISLMTSIICILAPISIPLPISPVPITLGTFALYLSLYILNTKEAVFSTLMYLFLGSVGLPVFSGYGSGFSRFFGAGGGYLLGYIFLVAIGGYFVNKYESKPVLQILGSFIATVVTYIIGAFWLAKFTNVSFIATIPTGILIYLPLDIVKMILACYVGRNVKARIFYK